MTAIALIKNDTGGSDNCPSACPTTVCNLRYNEADDNDQDLCNPVTIPSCGTKWSFWKHNFVNFTCSFTQICNINWFVSCFNWTGTTLWIDDNIAGLTHASAGADDGYEIADGLNNLNTHAHITTPVNAGTAYCSTSCSKAIDIDEGCSVINAAGEESNYWVTALELTTCATSGTQATKTVTVEYDEI